MGSLVLFRPAKSAQSDWTRQLTLSSSPTPFGIFSSSKSGRNRLRHRAAGQRRGGGRDAVLLDLVLDVVGDGGVGGAGGIIITGVGVVAAGADGGAVLPEEEGDAAAGESEEEEDHASPLVAAAGVHLLGEEDDGGAPEGAEEGLGGEGRGGLVLVRVDNVVVGGVVEEDKAEADGEAADGGADPVEARVRRPGEDGEADGDEPARAHHGDETVLGRGVAVPLRRDLKVVFVDKGGAERRG